MIAFGNRWNQKLTTTGSSAQQPSYTFDGYNHITSPGVVYDALGNVTNDGTHSYTYDAENRLIQVDGGAKASYTYDAAGQRVKVAKAGGVSSEFLYDLGGRVIVELDGTSGTVRRDELFAGGQHIATYADGTTYFRHQDWLGTKRVSTDPTGTVVETCTNLPFGDGGNCTGANASLISFTDFDHDSESNLEHAWFRQLSTTQGRWMTPDPYTGSMDLTDPQSFNRYAYVEDNPMNGTDPYGLFDDESSGDGPAIIKRDVWAPLPLPLPFWFLPYINPNDHGTGTFGGSGGGSNGGGGSVGSVPSTKATAAANNASNRLTNLLNQLKKCPQAAGMANSLMRMQASGKLVLANLGGADGSTSLTGTISIDSTYGINAHNVAHEYFHTIQRDALISAGYAGTGIGPLPSAGPVVGMAAWVVARDYNAVASILHGSSGFGPLDVEAEAFGQQISSQCGID